MLMYILTLQGRWGRYGMQYFSNSLGHGHTQSYEPFMGQIFQRTHLGKCQPSVFVRFLKYCSLLCSRNVTFFYTLPQLSCLFCAYSSIFVQFLLGKYSHRLNDKTQWLVDQGEDWIVTLVCGDKCLQYFEFTFGACL